MFDTHHCSVVLVLHGVLHLALYLPLVTISYLSFVSEDGRGWTVFHRKKLILVAKACPKQFQYSYTCMFF